MALVRGRDGLLDGVGGDAEILGFAGFEEDDLAAGVLDDVFEADPVGDGQNHFVAVVDEDLDCIEERMLAAGGEDGFIEGVVGAEVAGVALNDGLAHVRNSGHDGIAREIGFDGDDGRVFDVTGRGEMRFPGAEVDQVGSLGAEFGGLGGNSHGGRDFNAADAVGEGLGGSSYSHDPSILADFVGCIQRLRKHWPFSGVLSFLDTCGRQTGNAALA